MSMQDQIDALSEMVQGHSVPIIAQGAAIRFLSNMMRSVLGSDYDEAVESLIANYEESLKPGPLKDPTIEEIRGLLTND